MSESSQSAAMIGAWGRGLALQHKSPDPLGPGFCNVVIVQCLDRLRSHSCTFSVAFGGFNSIELLKSNFAAIYGDSWIIKTITPPPPNNQYKKSLDARRVTSTAGSSFGGFTNSRCGLFKDITMPQVGLQEPSEGSICANPIYKAFSPNIWYKLLCTDSEPKTLWDNYPSMT